MRLSPRPPALQHSCAVGLLTAAQPAPAPQLGPLPLRRRPRSPGTCVRPAPAAAQLFSAGRAHGPAPGLPSRVSILPPPPGSHGGRLAAPGAPRPRASPRLAHPAAHAAPATGTYGVRLRRRERVSPGVHGASGPARPAAAPHSTAQKMDAGGWAPPARPAPGAGRWTWPVPRRPARPSEPRAGARGTRGAEAEAAGGRRRGPGTPTTAPRGPRPHRAESGLRLHLLRQTHSLKPAEGQFGEGATTPPRRRRQSEAWAGRGSWARARP